MTYLRHIVKYSGTVKSDRDGIMRDGARRDKRFCTPCATEEKSRNKENVLM